MKAVFKRIFSKARWFLLILILGILAELAFIFFDFEYYTHNGDSVCVTPDEPFSVSRASVNGGRIAAIDSTYLKYAVAVADMSSGESICPLRIDQIPRYEGVQGTVNDVVLADDGSVYAHIIYWENDSDNIKKEDIVRFSAEGSYDDRIFYVDHKSDSSGRYSQIRPVLDEISFKNGKVRFACCGNTETRLYEFDHATGLITEGEDLSDGGKKVLKVLSDGSGYLVIDTNGKVYSTDFGKPLGEPIYTCKLDITNSEGSHIINCCARVGDKLYVTMNFSRNTLFELSDGQLTEVYQLPENSVIMALDEADGALLIQDGNIPYLYSDGSARPLEIHLGLLKNYLFNAWLDEIAVTFIGVGLIGLLIWVILKKKTLLTKTLIVMIPIMIAVSAGLFLLVYSKLSSQYFSDRENEIVAVCELASASLDDQDFTDMTSLDRIDPAKYSALTARLSSLCNGNRSKWGKLYTMYIVLPDQGDKYRALTATDTLTLPNERVLRFYSDEELESHRVSDTDRVSLFKPDYDMFSFEDVSQFEAFGKILDEDGSVKAYLVVTAALYNVTITRFYMMGELLIYVLLITVVMIGVTTFFAVRISRLIKKTTDTVSKIAGGDLTARMGRSSKDEFGEICTQVNKMAQNLETMFEEKDRNEKFYYKFVPKKFSELLGKENLTDLSLGDAQSREFTVLFCDIRSFSLNSEMMTAKEIFRFVNVIYGIAGPIIRSCGGFVDKYIGDAVMALFESPDQAVKAGIELYRSIVLDPEAAKKLGITGINIGVGIHTGMAEIGIVGEEERLSGTVISDTVNLSSRLESLTKTYKTAMLISKDTLDRMQSFEELDMRYLGIVQVAGVNEVKSVYEVLDCLPDEERALRSSTKAEFKEALRLFHMGERAKAAEQLNALVESGRSDHVEKMYLDYIRSLSDEDKGSVFRFVRK